MADELKIHVEVTMENQEYLIWNVAGCARRLKEAPHEYDTTLAVY